MATKLVIANGLRLDFTLAAAGGSDNFLGVDATGSPTYFASVPVIRIAAQTPNRAATFNGSGFLAPSATTATELGFVAGVTSAIQTQLNAKQPLIVLAFNRAVVSDGAGALTVSATTATEIGYSTGVTSSIQTQLNAKQATITGGASSIVSSNLTVNRALMSDGSGKVAVSTVTTTELGYSSGVTSALQSQINAKLTVTVTAPASGDVITYNGSSWVNSASAAQGVPVGGTAGQYLNKINSTNYNTQWSTLVAAKITDLTSTAAELNLLHGVTTSTVQFNYLNTTTGDIQSQLNARLINNLALNAIWVGNASNVAAQIGAGTSGYVLTSVSGVPTWQPSAGGGGGLAGPGTSTLNAAVRWSNTLGTVVKDSVVVITDAGLMTGGTWNGNLIAGQYGGTGVANTGKTITLGGNLTTSGAFASTFTMTGTTGVTFPTSGTLLTSAFFANGNGTTWTVGTPAYDWGGPLTGNVIITGTDGILIRTTGQIDLVTGVAGAGGPGIGNTFLAGWKDPALTPNNTIYADSSLIQMGYHNIGINNWFEASSGGLVMKVANGTTKLLITEPGVWTVNVGSDAIGDIYQRNASGNFARLASVATGNVLISGGVATVNSWGKVGLTTHVSGILPIANGGTGSSSTTYVTLTTNVTGILPLANGGTASNLSDPGADRLWGWDDTDNAISFITLGSGLTYTHATHTLTAAGGGGTPGGSNTQVQFNNSGAFGGNANFTINSGTGVVTLGQIPVFTLGIGSAIATTQAAADNSTKVATTAYVDNLTLPAFTTTLDGFVLASGGAGRLLLGDNTWLSTSTNGFVLTLVAGVPAWAAAAGGMTNPMTTIGDLIQGTTAGAPARLADVAVGSYLRSGGVGASVVWSTSTLPNTTTTGDILYASASNVYSNLADVAVGSYLRSGGVTTAPVWSAVTLPNAATTGDLVYASATNVYANLTSPNVGHYLRSVAVGTAPIWSTTTIPNTATTGDIWSAVSTNSMAALAATTAGTFLRSNGAGVGVGYSTTVWPNAATVGDMLQATSTNTYTNLAAVATGNALISGGVATVNAWGKIGLTTHISGILPPANGGTGIANNAASTLTISGAFASTFTVTGTTAVTFPTSGTLSTFINSASANSLMMSDGTNAINSPISYSSPNLSFASSANATFGISGTNQLTIKPDQGVASGTAATIVLTNGGTTIVAFSILGSAANATNTTGGDLQLVGGSGYTVGATNGGNVILKGGVANGAGSPGSIKIGSSVTEKIGFFNATPILQPSVNTILVNNVTSGGTVSIIADYSSLSVYATDAATIRNNFFRMAEKILKLETALRNFGQVID